MQKKPNNISLKDFLVEKISKELEIGEDECEELISWSYKQAKEAMHNNREVEFSGWGKMKVSPVKLHKRLFKLECIHANMINQIPVTEFKQKKIKILEEDIKLLKDKI